MTRADQSWARQRTALTASYPMSDVSDVRPPSPILLPPPLVVAVTASYKIAKHEYHALLSVYGFIRKTNRANCEQDGVKDDEQERD
jgi:hypothetical protein